MTTKAAAPKADPPASPAEGEVVAGGKAPVADHPLSPAPASAPPEHRNFLQRVGHDIETGAVDIVHFVTRLPTIIKAWNSLAPQVKGVAVQIFHDVLTIEHLVAEDIADGEKGDITGVITLTGQTVTAIKQLVADAKAGEQGIVDSLKVLGITLPS